VKKSKLRPLEDPATEAEKHFPGSGPVDECLRSAYVAIVAARAPSALAAENLEQLREIACLDPEELEDSAEGWTIVEGGLEYAADDLEEARRECRRAIAMLRRTRRLRPRRPRKLENVS
jgi:hypothetical protein